LNCVETIEGTGVRVSGIRPLTHGLEGIGSSHKKLSGVRGIGSLVADGEAVTFGYGSLEEVVATLGHENVTVRTGVGNRPGGFEG
jgi:hypothetical protein